MTPLWRILKLNVNHIALLRGIIQYLYCTLKCFRRFLEFQQNFIGDVLVTFSGPYIYRQQYNFLWICELCKYHLLMFCKYCEFNVFSHIFSTNGCMLIGTWMLERSTPLITTLFIVRYASIAWHLWPELGKTSILFISIIFMFILDLRHSPSHLLYRQCWWQVVTFRRISALSFSIPCYRDN